MDYALASELRDAGFPFAPMEREHQLLDTPAVQIPEKGTWYVCPTLEELIEACGNTDGFVLGKTQDDWMATIYELRGNGSTPTEAVARLWLALNRTESSKS
jgi:hypothetical protein